MIYIGVIWLHSFADEPRILYSEIDNERWETRKVEEFPDGRLEFASAEALSGGTRLGEALIPSLEEIGSDPQFQPQQITGTEFETIWQRATPQL